MAALGILALWLTPAVWLGLFGALLEGGAPGLWAGLAVVLGPLVALGLAAPSRPARARSRFPGFAFLLAVAVLLWANLTLAGDVAAALGAPRWHGVALAGAGGFMLTLWPGAARVAPVLVVGALAGLGAPLVLLAHASGVGPVTAWERVADREAFRFPASSPWVTNGRALAPAHRGAPIAFDEEHRVTATGGATLRVRAQDGQRVTEREWELGPGESVTLRPGDELQPTPGLRLRFQAGRRVPGAPESGLAWAEGERWDALRGLGLAVTVVGGAVGLLAVGAPAARSRLTVALTGAGLIATFLLAQGWAIYAALGAPDLFLGGVAVERLVELPTLVLGDGPWGRGLQALLVATGMAGLLASSAALRRRWGRLARAGDGEGWDDPGLWVGVFGVAALASLWPRDPWAVVVIGLGAAASALAPAALLGRRSARAGAVTAAGALGLGLFALLAGAAELYGPSAGTTGAVLAYPALVAAPVGAGVLWLARGSQGR